MAFYMSKFDTKLQKHFQTRSEVFTESELAKINSGSILCVAVTSSGVTQTFYKGVFTGENAYAATIYIFKSNKIKPAAYLKRWLTKIPDALQNIVNEYFSPNIEKLSTSAIEIAKENKLEPFLYTEAELQQLEKLKTHISCNSLRAELSKYFPDLSTDVPGKILKFHKKGGYEIINREHYVKNIKVDDLLKLTEVRNIIISAYPEFLKKLVFDKEFYSLLEADVLQQQF